MKNKIYQEQQTEKYKKLLAAQKAMYSLSLSRLIIWFIIYLIISIISAISLDYFNPKISVIILLVLFIFEILTLLGGQKIKSEAALVQDMYDRGLYKLNNNKIIVKQKLIDKYYLKYMNNPKTKKDIFIWYGDYSNKSLEIGRLMCQKENNIWDLLMRIEYLKLLIIFSLIGITLTFGVFITMALFPNFELFNYLSTLLLIPIMIKLIELIFSNITTIKSGIEINKELNNLNEIIEDIEFSSEELTKKAEKIQEDLYSYRQKAPKIPDFFYEGWKERHTDFN